MGERAFCAGQDLDEAAAYDIDDVDRWFTEMHAMYAALRALDKPTVAALFGAVAGAGYQLALYCDMRIAHPPDVAWYPAGHKRVRHAHACRLRERMNRDDPVT